MSSVHDIERLLKHVTSDNTSGSVQIALNVIKRLKSIIKRKDTIVSGHFCEMISEQLISAQPSMGIILNLAYGIGKMADTVKRNDILLYLDQFETEIGSHTSVIAVKVSGLLKRSKMVMTYSSSSTVFESLRYAYMHGSRFKVVVLESRPMNEGAHMMRQLSNLSIPVTYTTDAAGMSMLASVDIGTVIIGGDAIHKNGFVCKTGSRAITEICKIKKIPLYGLCGTEKIIPKELNDRFVILNKPEQELTKFKNRFVTIVNRYFEVVPLDMFTKIITD